MSNARTVSRLEALLERIHARAAQPRARPMHAPPPSPHAPPAAPITTLAPESAAELIAADLETTLVQRVRSPGAEPELLVDVDVQEVTAEAVIDVPAEEVVVAEPLDSRERLVAAEPVAESLPADGPSEPEVVTAIAARPGLEESPADVLSAVEEVEEAPLSSRRPVAPQPEERLADMAFGAEEPRPPRHTPPPESGRLPAAPDLEFEADVTGVRDAGPTAVASAHPRLVPEPISGNLGAGDGVAEVVSAAQQFSPATFTALLDASLAL